MALWSLGSLAWEVLKPIVTLLLIGGQVVLLPGCAVHQVRHAPEPLVGPPAAHTAEPEAVLPGPWWEAFEDPELNDLIATALRENFSLAQGVSRIERAEALLVQARALRLPQVEFGADVSRRWERRLRPRPSAERRSIDIPESRPEEPEEVAEALLKQAASGGGGGSGGGSSGGGDRDRDSWETQFDSGLGLRWEVDLWGRLQALAAAEREEVAALVEEYEALRLLLSAEVAEAYYQALEQRLQLQLLEEQRRLAATFLELLELRFLQGDASAVDVLQQRGQLAGIETEEPAVRAQLGLLENRLDVLLGAPPDRADRTHTPATGGPFAGFPELAVPLALLQQRPDLRSMQRRVVAQDHRIAAAIAERLPRVTLTGGLDYRYSGGTAQLLGTGAAGLLQPVLDWGLRRAGVEANRATWEGLLLEFTQVYIEAIEEVETTLWQEARQRERIEALAAREAILRDTVDAARVRYSLGVTDYLPVLTALQDLQRVQRDLLTARQRLISLRIQLYRAVGGPTRPQAHDVMDGAAV